MAGAMDLEDQWKLGMVVDRYGSDNVMAVLGCPDAESSQIQAETVIAGDPSLSGPLTDRALGLFTIHAVELLARNIVNKSVFAKYIQPYMASLDQDAITHRLDEIRSRLQRNAVSGR